MRIRLGFVSNSSSSSFVIGLDHAPESVEELQEMLFGDIPDFRHPYQDDVYSARYITQRVWNDLKEPISIEQLRAELGQGSFEGHPDISYRADGTIDREKYERQKSVALERVYEKEKGKFQGKTLYVLRYSDNDGEVDTAMEHGDLFRRVPHVRISHH